MDRNKTWPTEFSFGAPGVVTSDRGEGENHPGNSFVPHSEGLSTMIRRGSGREGHGERVGTKNEMPRQPLEMSFKVFMMHLE